MKLINIIQDWITGDWGNDKPTDETPIAVHCIRSADIAAIYNFSFEQSVIRYISTRSLKKSQLQVGDIIVEKSGGTNNCSTGRVIYVSEEILKKNTPLVCSNFCTAFRVKEGWYSLYVYYLLQVLHRYGIFGNFEGKTSGIHNLMIEAAYSAIEIPNIKYNEQVKIANALNLFDTKLALNRQINQNLPDYLAA